MSLPMLQVALDNQTLSHAYETTRLIAEEVDIIEVGTILCVGEGVRAVRDLKALYPHKIVLADAKIADAGKILSRMCFEANADWVTVICCADINTAKGALDVAKEFNGDVQIELTGFWTREQAQEWREAGIQQVVYHRSRDARPQVWRGARRISALSNVWRIWALKSPSPVVWRWKICRCSRAFRFTSLLPVAAFVMRRPRWKRRVSSNAQSLSFGAKERVCCQNRSRLASMKRHSLRGVLAGAVTARKTAGLRFCRNVGG